MTVSTVVDHNDYTGNGVTTSFPYTFRIFKKTDLTVSVVDLNENITVLVLDTDYTVTNAGGYNGGNVVLTTPLTNGWQISIARELEPTQETDLRNQGKFFAEVHEDAFDKLTMLIQQTYSVFRLALRKPSSVANWYDALNNYIRNLRDPLQAQDAATKNYVDSVSDTNLNRTLRVPEATVDLLPGIDSRKNKVFTWDNNGQPTATMPPSGSATDVFIELAKPTGAGKIGEAGGSNVQDAVDAINPVTTLDQLLSRLQDTQKVNLMDSVTTVHPIVIPSFRMVEGNGFAAGFIGKKSKTYNTISKTGHETVTLTGANLTSVVDAIIALTDQWTPIDGVDNAYPQALYLKNLTIKGEDAIPNEVGIFVHQGGRIVLEDINVINCLNGIWLRRAWLSTLTRVTTLGKIKCNGGTSLTLTNCWAAGVASSMGAYDTGPVQYSSFINCASDGAPNVAYLLASSKVVMTGCGCESATSLNQNFGSAIAIASGVTAVVDGFDCSPRLNQTEALISIGANSTAYFNGWNSDFQIAYDVDVLMTGNDSTVIFENSRFLAGAKLPVVKFSSGATGKVIIRDGVNEYVYTAPPGSGIRTNPEAKYQSGTFTPTVTADFAVTTATYSVQTGSYVKSGNIATIGVELQLTSKGNISDTANITLSGFPYPVAKNTGVSVYGYSGINGANSGLFGSINASTTSANTSVVLSMPSTGALTNIKGSNITNNFVIKLSLSYPIFNSHFQ